MPWKRARGGIYGGRGDPRQHTRSQKPYSRRTCGLPGYLNRKKTAMSHEFPSAWGRRGTRGIPWSPPIVLPPEPPRGRYYIFAARGCADRIGLRCETKGGTATRGYATSTTRVTTYAGLAASQPSSPAVRTRALRLAPRKLWICVLLVAHRVRGSAPRAAPRKCGP